MKTIDIQSIMAECGPVSFLDDAKFQVGYEMAEGDVLQVVVDGEIGNPFEGITSSQFNTLLMENPEMPVEVRVNSPGGFAFQGISMMNALIDHEGPTRAIVTGMAGSAASILIMGADEIVMKTGTSQHVHRANIVAAGNWKVMEHAMQVLQSVDDDLIAIYMERTGQSRSVVTGLMEGNGVDGTKLSATKAKQLGFADKVEKRESAKAQWQPTIAVGTIDVAAAKIKLDMDIDALPVSA